MIREVHAHQLKRGDVLALPMGRTATVHDAKAGSQYVTVWPTEGAPFRLELDAPALLELHGSGTGCDCVTCAPDERE